jgi:DNA-binding response OmpR family regulator
MKVLLIDDNEEITELFETTLTAKGYSVKVSNDGKEGLDLIKKKESNLVLLDLAMPKYSGEDLVKELLKDGPINSYNIYLFTASVITEKSIGDLLKLGVKGYLKKPLRIDTLLNILKKFE